MSESFFATMRKGFADTPGILQTSEEVADVLLKVVEDPKPHLRYQTSAFVEQAAKGKFVDSTGDGQVKEQLKNFP
jgi:hypothetical protein